MTAEPLTPVAVEVKLRQLVNDLARAQAALRQGASVRTAYELAGTAG